MIKLTKNDLYNVGAMTKTERANYENSLLIVKRDLNEAWHGSKAISQSYAEEYITESDITNGYSNE